MLSFSQKKRRMNKSSRQSISTVDRISDLPDSILCHILYFLPTKFVATTSVLSKRWKKLWLSVLALDFDYRDFKNSTLFRRVMYSTMASHHTDIHSFSLKDRKCSPRFNQKDVDKIVRYALQLGIQNFDLNHSKYSRYLIELPVTILSCRTLEVLKLTNITVNNIFDKLLLSCPILEDLEVTKHCSISGLENRFSTNFIALPNLIKARISEFYIPLSMMFTCFMELPKFKNLTHLKLNFQSTFLYSRWTWLLGILKLSPKLQILIIQDNDALAETNDGCWQNLSVVPECLLLQLKTCHIRDYKGEKYDLKFAKYIIENSKVLNTMTINCTCSLDTKAKHRLYKKLSSCKRGSATYKLLFD
ncbi:hypothetical protein P8452_67012 [Trifolium repens]|nr:hypothetical protein P8452_67012 [Trifolium repens]